MLSQQLLAFLRAAECGSFTQAAKRLMVTPASVMKHINTLEGRLGVELFTRGRRGVELTAAGKSLYRDGRRLEALAQSAAARLRRAQPGGGVTIRVGSSLLNPSRVLTDLWEPLRSRYPQYKFSIVPYDDTKEQILSIVSDLGAQIDVLAGCFNSRAMQERASYLHLGYYRLCVAVPFSHPLAAKKRLAISDLYGMRLVMVRARDSEALDSFRGALASEHPQISVEETGYFYDLTRDLVCELDGIPLLTLDAWSGVHPSLVTLPVDWDYRVPYGLLYAKAPSPGVARFIEILREETEKGSR